MPLTRYEHTQVKHLIEGYMIPSTDKPQEKREEEFERAKTELKAALTLRIKQVDGFAFADLVKKVS